MAMRSRTTFKKRQKELARQEKQRDKAARRVQRRLEKSTQGPADDSSDDVLEPRAAEDSDDEFESIAHSPDQQ